MYHRALAFAMQITCCSKFADALYDLEKDSYKDAFANLGLVHALILASCYGVVEPDSYDKLIKCQISKGSWGHASYLGKAGEAVGANFGLAGGFETWWLCIVLTIQLGLASVVVSIVNIIGLGVSFLARLCSLYLRGEICNP